MDELLQCFAPSDLSKTWMNAGVSKTRAEIFIGHTSSHKEGGEYRKVLEVQKFLSCSSLISTSNWRRITQVFNLVLNI